MSTNAVREDPPEKVPKYDPVFRGACRQPRTFFRLPDPFKSYGSATYLKQTYAHAYPGFTIEFKSARVGENVWIYVAAFPVDV